MRRRRSVGTLNLDEARTRFENWRQSRRGKEQIPDELWSVAIEVARRDGVNPTAVALRLGQLLLQPSQQLIHQGTTVLLVKPQTLCGIETLLTGQSVIAVHHSERFQHVSALLREVRRDIYKLAPSVTAAGLRSLFRYHRRTTGVKFANPHRFRHYAASRTMPHRSAEALS
jgi:hypothetical protein